jgi:NAD(P)H dehydrogenase (quinone)
VTPQPVIAIAYHSGRGRTEMFAQAVARGARNAGASVTLIRVDTISEEEWAALDAADAIIFGSPTYMGTASGAFHVFAEATFPRWTVKAWEGKLAAGFTNSSCKAGDKHSTLAYFATLAAQHLMNWVNLGLHPGWFMSHGSENDINRLGFFNGAAATTPGDHTPDEVHKADIATAEHLGSQVAQQTAIVLAGRAALGLA